MPEKIRIEHTAGTCWITLDDGKVNALSPQLIGEIEAGLDEAEAAAEVVALRGRPGIFSAGFDFKTFAEGREAGLAMVRAGAELVLRLLAFARPVLTVCTGHAYPAGAFLMMAADSRLGIAGPWKLGMNEVAIGMTVPRFAVELARHRLTPAGFAQIATGRLFAPEEAAPLGYLDRVLAPEALEGAAGEEATRLCALDRPSFEATKQRLNQPAIAAIRAGLDAEAEELAEAWARAAV